MSRDDFKRMAAEAALRLVGDGWFLGIGTGSTTGHFIDGLSAIRDRVRGAVPSSTSSQERLQRAGIPIVDLRQSGRLPLYVDGADEATRSRQLIKGGGGALTREKIVASASEQFVCILDESKLVERLGAFPVAVEVIPLAEPVVARSIELLGGRPVVREGFVTDNGNRILDVHGFLLEDGRWLEEALDQIPGVVCNGLFCRRPADRLLVAGATGVETVE